MRLWSRQGGEVEERTAAADFGTVEATSPGEALEALARTASLPMLAVQSEGAAKTLA